MEIENEFLSREQQNEGGARQKCWVAATFASDDCSSNTEIDSEDRLQVYYGCIHDIWVIGFKYRTPSEQMMLSQDVCVTAVDWMKNLKRDFGSGLPYATIIGTGRKAVLRNKERTLEDLSCIMRVIGFFDFDGRRYFLDPEERSLETGEGGTLFGFRN